MKNSREQGVAGRSSVRTVGVFTLTAGLVLALGGCPIEECADGICDDSGGAGGSGGGGGTANGGSAGDGGMPVGGGGTGGNAGGGGSGGAPECMTDGDCTTASAARCDAGTCVACTASPQCTGVPGLPVCDAGTCIECKLGEEAACMGNETCDLLANACVATAPESVQNCQPCTNDAQCTPGHRCIEMDFEMQPHGHYCLKEDTGGSCARPFGALINKPSISGAAATDYCGIEEDLATCEAVNALLQGWVCTGTDGMCGPEGMPEVAVPGSSCEQVGALPNQCTYTCGVANHCPATITCGSGSQVPPGWCGG